MSGTPPLVSQGARVPVANLSYNAAQLACVKSPRARTSSVEGSHGVVLAAGTSASSVVTLSQVTLQTTGARASGAVPLDHGLSSAKGPNF